MIEQVRGTLDDLYSVYDRIRPYDKGQLDEWKLNRDNLHLAFGSEFYLAIKKDGVPEAIVGTLLRPRTVQVFFFGTEAVNRHKITMARIAKAFLQFVRQTWPEKRCVLFKFPSNEDVIPWLKWIGFYEIGRPGKLTILEWS